MKPAAQVHVESAHAFHARGPGHKPASAQPLGVKYTDHTPEQRRAYNNLMVKRSERRRIARGQNPKKPDKKAPGTLDARASKALRQWSSLLPPGIEP